MSRKSTIKFLTTIFFSVSIIISHAQVDIQTDTLKTTRDSVTTDTIRTVPKKESDIKAPIKYSAKDSMMFSIKTKMIYAYGEANLAMEEMKLESGYIVMNMDSNYIYAEALPNEKGELEGDPVFTQGDEEYELKTIKYNTKSKKGIVTDVVTEANGGYLHGGKTKMQPNKEIHIINGKFTTCDADHPHFYIQLTRAKVVPEKKIVTGPFYFVIADIPIYALGLPFGYFPSQQNRTSGIILPTWGEEERRGFFLQQGGYYWAASENMDLVFLGDIYSSGSWSANIRSNYKKRYKYAGGFDLSYQKVIVDKDIPDEATEMTNFWVRLNYARDSKANPTTEFSANLNFGSSKHRQYNSTDPSEFANNNASSSIAFSKTFPGTPFNFSANVSATQNLSTNMVNLTLPTLTFTMAKQNPFKRKNAVGGNKWYEQISVSFSSSLKNSINIKDSLLFTKDALKKFENGLDYKIPINTSIKVFKYFNLSPGISYTGKVFTKYYKQRLHISDNDTTIYTDTLPLNGLGLYHAYDFSFSTPLSTTIYGQKNFKKGKIAAIRHVMNPSVSFSYHPDFSKEFWNFYDDNILYPDDESKRFSRYGGYPSRGESGSIGFSLGNNFEMKVHSKDTTEELKKIVLLKSLNFGTSYNLLADSFQWSDLTISANTMLLKQISVTYSGAVDLYKLDKTTGERVNQTYLESDDHVLGHLKRSSITLSGSISSDTFKKKGEGKGEEDNQKPSEKEGFGTDETSGLKTNKKKPSKEDENVSEYNFKMPWSLSINYTLSYTNEDYNTVLQKYEPVITQAMNLTGNLSLTDKWKVSASGSYDFKENKLTHASLRINRDLHCWQMGFNCVPLGTYKSYSFVINVKSSMFQGLEYKKQQSYFDNLTF